MNDYNPKPPCIPPDVTNVDFPPIGEITAEVRDQIITSGSIRGDARLAIGRFRTDTEFAERRRKELSTQLP